VPSGRRVGLLRKTKRSACKFHGAYYLQPMVSVFDDSLLDISVILATLDAPTIQLLT
jgi:hypothetical protein